MKSSRRLVIQDEQSPLFNPPKWKYNFLEGVFKISYYLIGIRPLVLWTIAFFLSGTGALFFQQKQMRSMHYYPLFTIVLNHIAILLVFIPPNIMKYLHRKAPSKTLGFPRWKIAILAVIQMCGILLQTLAMYKVNERAVIWKTLMDQVKFVLSIDQKGVLPFSILFSFILLHKRYNIFQVFGFTGIFLGVILSLIPFFVVLKQTETALVNLLWGTVYLFGTIPLTVNQMAKEWMFRTYRMGLLWLGIWEYVFSIPLVIIFALPSYSLGGLSVSDVPHHIFEAFRCLAGREQLGEDCSTAFLDSLGYWLFAGVYTISCLAVVRFGSANLLFLLSAFLLPITILIADIGSLRIVFGVFGIIIMIIGLSLYAFGTRKSLLDNPNLKSVRKLAPDPRYSVER